MSCPGNDDAGRAITLYCDLIAKAAIDGISRAQGDLGVDIGAAAEPVVEELPAGRRRRLGFEPLPGPRGVADDLKKLPGVSPAVEKKLNDLGMFHYSQIAELSADGRAQHRRGGRPARPRRGLDRARRRSSPPSTDVATDAWHSSTMLRRIGMGYRWQRSPPRW